ncbi:MAG: hypothetical protein LKE40_01745 [Spirochaetia bacterium]|jgi:hypothetical protein|nr:hypothetical protein [Spirochaetia bacterium]
MQHKRSFVQQVFFSFIISAGVLFLGGFLFIRYLVPKYNIHAETLYHLMIYIFPVLIGLCLIEVASIIADRNTADAEDKADILPRNSYDAPLFTLPGDDPLPQGEEPGEESEKEETFEPIRKNNPQSAEGKEHAYVSLNNETMKVLNRLTPTQVMDILNYLEHEDIQPFVQSAAEPSATGKVHETTVLPTLESALAYELEESIANDYDLSVCIFAQENGLPAALKQTLLHNTDNAAFSYVMNDGAVCLIFPFYNIQEASHYLTHFFAGHAAGQSCNFGFSTRKGRRIDAEVLLQEAETDLKNRMAAQAQAFSGEELQDQQIVTDDIIDG